MKIRIINLTLHQLTAEQVKSLQMLHPDAEMETEPRGRLFTSIEDRREFAGGIYDQHEWLIRAGYDLIIYICGGDTCYFVILDRYLRHWGHYLLLFSDTERIRDQNDRFVFNFKGWIALEVMPDYSR